MWYLRDQSVCIAGLTIADNYGVGYRGRLIQLLSQSTTALNVWLCLQKDLFLPTRPASSPARCKPAMQQHRHAHRHRGTEAQMRRVTEAQMHRCTDAQMHRCTDAQMHRCTDAAK